MRAKSACSELVESANFTDVDIESTEEKDTLDRKLARSLWAALIKRVFEVNPLIYPHCGQEMRIIAFIEKHNQYDVIEGILKHCNLWQNLLNVPVLSLIEGHHLDSPWRRSTFPWMSFLLISEFDRKSERRYRFA